jgi:hypothetical protein
MNWSDIDFRPSPRKLRQFAAIWIVVFALLALRGSHALALIAAIGVIGLLLPIVMRPLFVAASVVAFPIGWVVSRVLLAIIFYVIFTPVAMLFRIVRRDPLRLRKPDSQTYWLAKESAGTERYFRQF